MTSSLGTLRVTFPEMAVGYGCSARCGLRQFVVDSRHTVSYQLLELGFDDFLVSLCHFSRAGFGVSFHQVVALQPICPCVVFAADWCYTDAEQTKHPHTGYEKDVRRKG